MPPFGACTSSSTSYTSVNAPDYHFIIGAPTCSKSCLAKWEEPAIPTTRIYDVLEGAASPPYSLAHL